jgi:hypothetical protein
VPPEPQAGCLATWHLTSSSGLLAEQRSSGPPLRDYLEQVEAAEVSAAHAPLRCARPALGRPAFFLSPDRTTAVVDRAFSSTLSVVDLTALGAGAAKVLGALTPAGRALPGRDLLDLLLRAEVLRPYAHLEATLCLEREQEDAAGYRAQVKGEHVFFTGRKNTRPFAFEFERTTDGALRVTGR